jgi:hypothetical protein
MNADQSLESIEASRGCTAGAMGALSTLILLLTVAFLPSAVSAQVGRPSDPQATPVRIDEGKFDNEHGVTSSDCILVMPDGRFHLERRRVTTPNPPATLTSFESSLDSSQLEQLREIISHAETNGLPEYDSRPVGFQNAPWFSSASVDIGEGETTRRFGYWAWDKRNAGPNVPADVKKRWHDSEVALRPLLEWLHGIEALNLPPSDARSTQCFADGP